MQTTTRKRRDSLNIPAFLRRRRARRREQHAPPPPPPPRPPEGDEWKQAQRFHVFLEDEIPQLGCGWRAVWAAIDSATVRLAHGPRRATIRLDLWTELQRHAQRHGAPLGQLSFVF